MSSKQHGSDVNGSAVKRNLNAKYVTPLTSNFARIRRVLQTEENSGKLAAAEVLGRAKVLNNDRNRRLVYSIRNKLKADLTARKAQSQRSALRSLREFGIIHHERYGFACSAPRELVRLVGQVAVRERCMGLWYRASNRNGMLVWTEPRREFTIQLYLTGGCQIVVSRKHQKQLVTVADLAGLRDRVEKSFYDEILRKCGGDPTDSRVMPTHGFMDADFWRRYEAWTNMFCVVRRHRVFTVLDEHHSFPPFRIETYKKERGLVISSDGSHPHSIEVHETVPDSLSRMMFDRVMRTNELLEKIVDLLSTPRKEDLRLPDPRLIA